MVAGSLSTFSLVGLVEAVAHVTVPASLANSVLQVELTGLDITLRMASGQCLAQFDTRSRTMPALILKRSSRVMPGLRGTPAGMMTTSASLRAAPSSASPA